MTLRLCFRESTLGHLISRFRKPNECSTSLSEKGAPENDRTHNNHGHEPALQTGGDSGGDATLAEKSTECPIRRQSIRYLGPDPIIVGWDGPSDPDNPLNWSKWLKFWIVFVLSIYSFIVYCGSSILVPAYDVMMVRYGVSREVVSLTLALYTFGYGVGPMLFSPLSEVANIGRNPPYVISFIFFLIVSIILAVVDNFPSIVVLRFLQGFFGSPCLASTGASIQDIYPWSSARYGLAVWILSICCGPALGPVLSAYAVPHYWHWPFWEIVIMAGPVFIALLVFLPETLPDKILLRRAQAMRITAAAGGKRKGIVKEPDSRGIFVSQDQEIYAPCEVNEVHVGSLIKQSLTKPTEIAIKDPAIAFACIYTSLIYAIYYSFFEVFPHVYVKIYKMSIGSFSLMFISIAIGGILGITAYIVYTYYYSPFKGEQVPATPDFESATLLPAIPATCLAPIGLFLFAWTSRVSIHWIVPSIGIVIYAASVVVIFSTIFVYLPLSYPKYMASLMAANDFIRSTAAAVFVMVTGYMYQNLGPYRGVTLLAGLSIGGIGGVVVLYAWGVHLRARSRFAVT